MGLFGPSRKEIWSAFAEEIGGSYLEFGLLKESRIEKCFGENTLYLDTYYQSAGKVTIIKTRIRVPVIFSTNFELKLYEEGIFSNMGKMLGMQDIDTIDEDFNAKYVIKGAPETIIRTLFGDATLRSQIKQIPKILLEVKKNEGSFGPKYGENEGLIYFELTEEVKKKEKLQSTVQMMEAFIQRLRELNLIESQRPEVRLYKV